MGISGWQLILVLVIVFVLFGAGKLPRVMGDLGRGVRSMKDGLNGANSDQENKKHSKDKAKTKVASNTAVSARVIDVEETKVKVATKKTTAKKKAPVKKTTAKAKSATTKKTAAKKAPTKKKATTKKKL